MWEKAAATAAVFVAAAVAVWRTGDAETPMVMGVLGVAIIWGR